MSSRRVLKAAEAIREVVSMAIITELRDPRICDVTVTYVEVSSDMRSAKVHVSVMGDQAKQELSLKGLRNAAGFLQLKVGQRIETRYTPKIRFILDQGVKRSLEVARILHEVLPEETPLNETPSAETPSDETPSDETPSGETPSDETPSAETPSDETPSAETPSDETPSDETPSDETPSDGAFLDADAINPPPSGNA